MEVHVHIGVPLTVEQLTDGVQELGLQEIRGIRVGREQGVKVLVGLLQGGKKTHVHYNQQSVYSGTCR